MDALLLKFGDVLVANGLPGVIIAALFYVIYRLAQRNDVMQAELQSLTKDCIAVLAVVKDRIKS